MKTLILPLIGLATLLAIGLIHCTAAWGAILPPEEYDHPYEGWLMIEHAHSQDDVRQRCPGGKFGSHALACAFAPKHRTMCIIVMAPADMIRAHGYDPADVMRHELAHCNGWPGDHRGAR